MSTKGSDGNDEGDKDKYRKEISSQPLGKGRYRSEGDGFIYEFSGGGEVFERDGVVYDVSGTFDVYSSDGQEFLGKSVLALDKAKASKPETVRSEEFLDSGLLTKLEEVEE